jgi:UDP-N-acetyl-D-glucosamine dehydrogenase
VVWFFLLLLNLGMTLVIWSTAGGIRLAAERLGRGRRGGRCGERPEGGHGLHRAAGAGRRDAAGGYRPPHSSQVAVLIAAHNEESVIERTIESARALVPARNIHVISDGSTDTTATRAHRAGVQVLELSPNRGKAGALAAGVEHFGLCDRFEVVLLLDADSRLAPDYLETGLPLFSGPDVAVVAGRAATRWEPRPTSWLGRGLVGYRERLYVVFQLLVKYGQAARWADAVTIAPGFASMYRTTALRQIDIAASGLVIEDFNMTFEVHARRLGRVAFHPRCAVAYTQDPDSFRDYRKQMLRWSLGFWQTVRRHRLHRGRFWLALALLLVDLIASSLTFATLPIAVVVSFGARALVAFAGVRSGTLTFLAGLVPPIDVVVGVLLPDAGLTILAAVVQRRRAYLLFAPAFPLLRIVDAALCLRALLLSFGPAAAGTWVSPIRRPDAAPGSPGSGAEPDTRLPDLTALEEPEKSLAATAVDRRTHSTATRPIRCSHLKGELVNGVSPRASAGLGPSRPVALIGNTPAPSVELSDTVTLDAVGVDAVRLDPVGVDAVTFDPVGVDAVTVDAVTLDPVGVDAVTVDAVRVDGVGADAVTVDVNVPEPSAGTRFDVCVLGLGYVGLPTALAFHAAGRRVLGVDISLSRLEAIRRSRVDLLASDHRRLSRALSCQAFELTTDIARLKESAAVIICVPTPIDEHLLPDLDLLRRACGSVVEHATPGQVLVLTSTTYVGCTADLLVKPLARRGLRIGTDIFAVFSPERIDPGNDGHSHEEVPRVVGGATSRCTERAAAVLAGYVRRVHEVSSAEAAEMVKLLENTFRAVNIALANEMADVASGLGVDIVEVIDAAATKPYGYMPFYPGPGVGGHCIPCDPHYLLWQLRRHRLGAPVIERAMAGIAQRPRMVVDRALQVLAAAGSSVVGARVLVAGVAYKPNVEDVRESPALQILDQLSSRGAEVSYLDPFVADLCLSGGRRLSSVPEPATVRPHLVIVHTLHDDLELGWLPEGVPVLDASYRLQDCPTRVVP